MKTPTLPGVTALSLVGLLVAILIARGTMAATQTAGAAGDDDYLTYAIPPDARKLGPAGTPEQNVVYYDYYVPAGPGQVTTYPGQPSTGDLLIAREWYTDGKLTKRELYNKSGPIFDNQHGPQREWYPNGQLKSEEFYKDGVTARITNKSGLLNGVSRYWDELGNLVGQYTMVNGNGLKMVFDSNGVLQIESELEDNVGNGFYFEREQQVDDILIKWEVDEDSLMGNECRFYPSGALAFVQANGQGGGPILRLNEDGTVVNTPPRQWTLYARGIVSEEEYAAAAAKDSSLPPYFSDTTKYIDYFVTPEVRAIEERYRNMPRVKIPLEFDTNGNPVLADGQPGADPAALMAPPPHYPPGYTPPASAPAVASTPKSVPATPPPVKPTPPLAQAESPSYLTPILITLGVLIVAGFFLRRRK